MMAPEEGLEPSFNGSKPRVLAAGRLRIVAADRVEPSRSGLLSPPSRGSQRLRRRDSHTRPLGYEPSELASAPLRNEEAACTARGLRPCLWTFADCVRSGSPRRRL